LKSASDLGIPLVGVGLLYQSGYFRQYLNPDGWQQETYPVNDFHTLPIQPVMQDGGGPLMIDVDFPGRKLFARVWKFDVGAFLCFCSIPTSRRTLRKTAG